MERGAELGECVRAIETELAKRELPGDVRRADREVRIVQCCGVEIAPVLPCCVGVVTMAGTDSVYLGSIEGDQALLGDGRRANRRVTLQCTCQLVAAIAVARVGSAAAAAAVQRQKGRWQRQDQPCKVPGGDRRSTEVW